jgi:hypothetical protein
MVSRRKEGESIINETGIALVSQSRLKIGRSERKVSVRLKEDSKVLKFLKYRRGARSKTFSFNNLYSVF